MIIRNFTKAKVKKYLKELEERIESYLQALDQTLVGPQPFPDDWLGKIRAEFSLSALAYNISRELNIVGVSDLIALLKSGQIRPVMA